MCGVREPKDNFAEIAGKDLKVGETVEQDEATKKMVEEKKEESSGAQKTAVNAIPKKVFIKIPFTSQAPFANWDEKHEEACEEASLIMLKYFLDKKPLPSEIADREILRMIDFEIKNLGHFEDSDVEEMVKVFEEFYDSPVGEKKLKIVYDFEKNDIKKYLAEGSPIIVPAAGRLLGNPNYKQPGPLYHALVLVGYEDDKIITNDPGTKRGESYKYSLDILYNAIHNFPGQKEEIESGRKAMIVLE